MGNTKSDISDIVTICPTCGFKISNIRNLCSSVTFDRKLYTIHQHGENVVVYRFNNRIICKYKSIDAVGSYGKYGRIEIIKESYEIMVRKFFLNENLPKFLLLNETLNDNLPIDIIHIVVNFWFYE